MALTPMGNMVIKKGTESVPSGSATHQLPFYLKDGVIVSVIANVQGSPSSVARCIPFCNASGTWFFSAVTYQLQPMTDALDVTYFYIEGDFR